MEGSGWCCLRFRVSLFTLFQLLQDTIDLECLLFPVKGVFQTTLCPDNEPVCMPATHEFRDCCSTRYNNTMFSFSRIEAPVWMLLRQQVYTGQRFPVWLGVSLQGKKVGVQGFCPFYSIHKLERGFEIGRKIKDHKRHKNLFCNV